MSNHRHKVGVTMYIGKTWRCLDCGQKMKCVGIGEHVEVDEDD